MPWYSSSPSLGDHSVFSVATCGTKEATLASASAVLRLSSTYVPVSREAFPNCPSTVTVAAQQHSKSASHLTSTKWRGFVKQATAAENVPSNRSKTRSPGWLERDSSSHRKEFYVCSGHSRLAAFSSPLTTAATITRSLRSGPLTSPMTFL